ncbi:MAG: Flp pilus assembly complex ATPase component TadA [Candidatus Ancillula sp.]|nr:Flp pilus assembly complex ATPase component TadA [Candidatus Ancillula sp.]
MLETRLDYLLNLENVTDVVINGPHEVFVDRGNGLEQVTLPDGFLSSSDDVRFLAMQLARNAGVRLDEASPIVDARLLSGVRLHAVLSPIAHVENGALISLRIPNKKVLSLEDLEDLGMFNSTMRAELDELIEDGANIIISGATGTGKTTLLSALIGAISSDQRIVCVEEAREISSNLHEHMVFLTARGPNIEGEGEVKMSQLLKATLRMRPDRIILGECRGEEVREYIMSLNTGHAGSLITLHANSAADVLNRLIQLGAYANLNSKLIKAQFKRGVHAVVHIKWINGRRVVDEIRRNSSAK